MSFTGEFYNAIDQKNIIIDSKSGYSGAGRGVHLKYKNKNLYESFSAYGVGFHKHNAEINQELNKEGFRISLESKKDVEENNIVIIDSFGKLDQYFKISDLVILGGSFLENIGGHNPIEPASYGCVVISGKYVDNWTNIYEDMVKANSCIIVNTFKEIDLKMRELLNNNIEIKKIQKNALEFSKGPFFENEQLYQDIEVYIN